MKNAPTLFLNSVIFLIAAAALAILIRFPLTEGRAVNLDLISIYSDPFIIFVYVSSLPFFAALFQAGKLLKFIEKNTIFSMPAIKALKNIKYYAVSIILLLLVAMGWIRFASGGEDSAGAIAVGIVLTIVSIVVATAAGVFQKILEKEL